MKNTRDNNDPEIPDWNDQDGWREEWDLNQILRGRPESTSREQRNYEEWD